MAWVSPVPIIAGIPWSQLPYFIGNKTLVTGSGYKNGHCLGFPPFLTPPPGTAGSSNVYLIPALPQTLTKIRVPFGLTGTAPSGNLVIQVWHSSWDASVNPYTTNFGTLTPDATATIPLSSLPSASAANNYQCSVTRLPYTEASFDHPVVFNNAALVDPMILLYLDTGFGNVSNIVFSSPQNDGVLTFTSDSLDFSTPSSTAQLYDRPYQDQFGTCVTTAGSEIRRGIYPDLFFGAASQPGGSWVSVIG